MTVAGNPQNNFMLFAPPVLSYGTGKFFIIQKPVESACVLFFIVVSDVDVRCEKKTKRHQRRTTKHPQKKSSNI